VLLTIVFAKNLQIDAPLSQGCSVPLSKSAIAPTYTASGDPIGFCASNQQNDGYGKRAGRCGGRA